METFALVAQLNRGARERRPLLATTFASGNVNSLLTGFAGRVVGFTAVVANPEVASIALNRELQQHAERFSGGGQAVNFAGMEGYVNARICVEALRRALVASAAAARGVAAAMTAMGPVGPGGFVVTFSGPPASASDWVDIVVRSRTGHLLK